MRPLLLLAAALAACSIPSRDFVDMSGAPDAMPDATPDAMPDAEVTPDAGPDAGPDAVPGPLALVSAAPAGGDVDIAPGAPIELTFNAAIDAASAAAAVEVTDSLGQPVAGAVEVEQTTVRFRPARRLGLLATYRTRVSTALRGTAGGTLAEPVTVSFTTRDGAWSTSRALVDGSSFNCADTAFDAAGAPLTTWDQSGASGRRNIWGTVGDGAPERLSITDTAASCPRLAASRGGTAIAIWTESASAQHLIANHYTVDRGWADPVTVDSQPVTLHAVTVDDQGNAHIAYNTTPPGSTEPNATWVRRWERTAGAWDPANVLVETDDMAVTASLAASSDGSVLAVWRSRAGNLLSGRIRGSMSSIDYARRATGDQEVAAVDPVGNALLLWCAASRVRARYYRAASDTWEGEEPIGNVIEAPIDPAVAFDDHGRAFAVWSDVTDEAQPGLWTRAYDPTPGAGWGAKQMIAYLPPNWSTPPPSSQPRIAVDGQGRALVVWLESDATRRRVWWNRRERDGTWRGPAVLDDTTAGTPSALRLAVDRSGAAHVVWTHTAPSQATSLRASRFE
jgi:hypothetical protein